MRRPQRLKRETGRYALVDGIPFRMPVNSDRTEALMAAFPIDADRANALLPGDELHAARLFNKGLLLITVVNYQETDIGRYIEFSIAIGCTHGSRPAPPLVPFALQKLFDFGQYVIDLPVSTEVSVKGGKGIWGMPKHRAQLDFKVGEQTVSSQYDLDDRLAMYIEIDRPRGPRLPLKIGAANFCAFRGMLMKSSIYFGGKANVGLGPRAKGRLVLGDHPRLQGIRDLGVGAKPTFTAFFSEGTGALDDHFESWFLSFDNPPSTPPEGLESVVGLGLAEDWLDPPTAEH